MKEVDLDRNRKKARQWREDVKKRDKYICRRCGSKENLHAHHISPWRTSPELRYEISNGMTLYSSCHAIFHITGHEVNEKTRQKISESKKGKTSWNKGKNHSKQHIEKLKIAKIGHVPWNKGKKKEIPKEKKCIRCNEMKEINCFTPLQGGKWISNICKLCRNASLKNSGTITLT